MKSVFGMTMAAAVALASLAAPASSAPLPRVPAQSPIVQVEGGCGPDFYRGRDGYCYRYHREYHGDRRCPPGWHWGYQSGRCWRD